MNIFYKKIGWFVDNSTSNDADTEVFSTALSAAIDLTDQFTWPKSQFSFQSVFENVSVCIIQLSFIHFNPLLYLKDANIYSGFHRSKFIYIK